MTRSHIEIQGLEEVVRLLDGVKGGAKKAITRGLNKGLSKGSTEAVKMVAQELNVTKATIRRSLYLRKATYRDPTCFLMAASRPLPFYDKFKPWKIRNRVPGMHFGGRKRKAGFSFQVKKGRARTVFPGAFVATMRSGHTGIYIRRTDLPKVKRYLKGSKSQWRWDHPLKELYSSSVPDILSNPDRMKPVMQAATEAATKEIARQAMELLKGRIQ